MVPYAGFNVLKFPDKAHAMEKIKHALGHLPERLPRGLHRRRDGGIDGVCCRRWTGRAGIRRARAVAGGLLWSSWVI